VGRPIDASVVARIQRFAQASHFKRGVLQLIAEELLARPGAAALLAVSASQRDLLAAAGEGSVSGGRPGGSAGSLGSLGSMSSLDGGAGAGGAARPAAALRELFRRLRFEGSGRGGAAAVDAGAAAAALTGMGYRLAPSEAAQLVEAMDTSGSGKVRRSAFAASQIDWAALQRNDVATWIEMARAAFSRLDADQDGGEPGGGGPGALGRQGQARRPAVAARCARALTSTSRPPLLPLPFTPAPPPQ
jgi:hypothetical protein